ncbi:MULTISPECIES: SpaA isopeptide-forming pilin-related protein [Clostridia]|uniref:SpaA isopeptide-forming pilin-related protein n=1 Tax=Clostridia TaxID=186801 RepID=UPI000E501044|nr:MULTISPECIES: SpaA isopeptide-forming pilin-related protein [Clostridia]RHV65210.1 LPXTG cell wall anchor domain-containing protein [Roseburia sp. OM02-15]
MNTKDITVKKNWNDGNAENRPTSVKIRLEYRNKGSNNSWNEYGTYTITEEDNNGTNAWTKVIHNLPTAYEYQVVELNSNDEVATAENNGNYVPSITKSGDTYTITNTLKWFAVKKSIGWDGDTSKSVGLSGAEFELKQNDTTIATGTSGDNGAITWVTADGQNVDLNSLNGTYVIHETKAPEGYMKSDTDWTVEFDNGLLTKLDGAAVTGDGNTGVEITLTNKKLYNLPHTGGLGIYLFTIGGMLLMGAAAWILYKNKCREVLKR